MKSRLLFWPQLLSVRISGTDGTEKKGRLVAQLTQQVLVSRI